MLVVVVVEAGCAAETEEALFRRRVLRFAFSVSLRASITSAQALSGAWKPARAALGGQRTKAGGDADGK